MFSFLHFVVSNVFYVETYKIVINALGTLDLVAYRGCAPGEN